MSIWTLLTIGEVVWVVAIAATLILERRSPAATLAWIGILAWLPIFGALVYFVFGPRRLRRRKLRRQNAKKVARALEEFALEVDDARWNGLSRAMLPLGEAPPLPARGVRFFFEGDPLLDAMVAAIDAAREHVHAEYYIFDADAYGTVFRDALVRAAKRGVSVRLLVDALGVHSVPTAFAQPLRDAGGRVERFNRMVRVRFANFRNHRKILVCDGTRAFVGGMNLTADHSARERGRDAWRDVHLTFEGPAVAALQRVFLTDWLYVTGELPASRAGFFPASERSGVPVQVVASGPDQDLAAVHQLFFAAITQAQERVWLTTPYFVPDEALLTALIGAALRKVDVRILVPAKSDNPIVDYAARSYFPELLRAGVRVFEFLPRVHHGKTLVIDDSIAIVGSANFDNRSFRLNFEVVAAIYDRAATTELATAFEADVASSDALEARELRQAGAVTRLLEGAARLLSPLL